MSTIESPLRFIAWAPARTVANAVWMFCETASSTSSRVVRCAGLSTIEPARFTIPSSRSDISIARSQRPCTAS